MTRTIRSGGVTNIARTAHNVNRVLQEFQNDPAPSPEWDEAAQWQRDSAIEGVGEALRGATARELHEAWCKFKEADGWVYGPVKDAELKTHPQLIDYDELDEGQKLKDAVFNAIVESLSYDQ